MGACGEEMEKGAEVTLTWQHTGQHEKVSIQSICSCPTGAERFHTLE